MEDVRAAALPAFRMAQPTEAVEQGTWVSTVVWTVLLAIPTALIITAFTLTPDPAGHGTHTQLGLPPCGFLVYVGVPCPGCGLTTCFTNMVRFRFVEATQANPFGVALFLVTLAGIPVSSMGIVRRLPVMATLDRLQVEKVAILLAVCSVVVWAVRVATLVYEL